MARGGKAPIKIPDGVQVEVKDNTVIVTGEKGRLEQRIHPDIRVEIQDGWIRVIRPSDSKFHKSLHGLYRSLINNMVEGVTKGFQKDLEIVGVGYRAELKGRNLELQLGYSHRIVFSPPEGIELVVDNPNSISVRGADKQLVGQIAAKIRSFRPPDPYKVKGIRYKGEYIRRKAGKAASAGGK